MRYYDFSVNQLEDKATELLIEFDKERLEKTKPLDVYEVIEKMSGSSLRLEIFNTGSIGPRCNGF